MYSSENFTFDPRYPYNAYRWRLFSVLVSSITDIRLFVNKLGQADPFCRESTCDRCIPLPNAESVFISWRDHTKACLPNFNSLRPSDEYMRQ